MRVVPKSNGSADDNSQKFWVFGPSFVQTPSEISSSSPTSSSEEERGPPRPPRPPLLLAMPAFKFKGKKRSGKTIRIPTEKVKKKKKKEEKGKRKQEGSTSKSRNRSRASKERWTAERYERASLMVIDVMRHKAAELGTRITRKDLRDEARKHIGDTGLLDHLLKHMAGKVVGDRGERFMRGFTSDGLMLYWLEPEELEERRRKGETVVECQGCETEFKEDIELLKERIGVMDRDLEDLRSLKELEKNIWKDNYERLLKRSVKLEIEMEKMNSSLQGLKENYERLLKRSAKLETYMAGMNTSFQGLKDEMLLLKEEKSREAEEEIAMNVGITEDAKVSYDNSDFANRQLQDNFMSRSPKASAFSPQMRRPYLQLPCRGRVLVNCPNGSQKSLGHLSQLPSPIESDQQPCVTNPQCTRQR